jgi:hypothetical protein
MDAASGLTMQTHLPTGRLAAITRVDNFQTPVLIEAARYILVVASEKPAVGQQVSQARRWFQNGLHTTDADAELRAYTIESL